MAVDTALVIEGTTVTADGNSDYIECEGGFPAMAHIYWGAMSGASTTCDVRIMASMDAGANYYMIGKFQQAGPTDDSKEDAKLVYVPQPTTPGTMVRVRLNFDVAGAAPSYAYSLATIEPLTSLAPPATMEQGKYGLALKMAAL